jgi:hypothetical protein
MNATGKVVKTELRRRLEILNRASERAVQE